MESIWTIMATTHRTMVIIMVAIILIIMATMDITMVTMATMVMIGAGRAHLRFTVKAKYFRLAGGGIHHLNLGRASIDGHKCKKILYTAW